MSKGDSAAAASAFGPSLPSCLRSDASATEAQAADHPKIGKIFRLLRMSGRTSATASTAEDDPKPTWRRDRLGATDTNVLN